MCRSWLWRVARKYENMPRMIAAQQNSMVRRKKETDLRARPPPKAILMVDGCLGLGLSEMNMETERCVSQSGNSGESNTSPVILSAHHLLFMPCHHTHRQNRVFSPVEWNRARLDKVFPLQSIIVSIRTLPNRSFLCFDSSIPSISGSCSRSWHGA